MNQILPGIYRYYKGNKYEVVGFAKNSETLEESGYAGLQFAEANGSLLSATLIIETQEFYDNAELRVEYAESEDVKKCRWITKKPKKTCISRNPRRPLSTCRK